MAYSLKSLLRTKIFRYVLIGGSAYVIEIATILAAQRLGANSVAAVALSFWIGFVYTFILQKFFTFDDNRTGGKIIASQASMVAALVILNFVFTISVTVVLQHWLPAMVIRTVAVALTTVWNFYLYKTRVFKNIIVD